MFFRQRNAALRGKTRIHDIITQPFAKPRSKIDFHETDIGRKVANNICFPGFYQRVRQRGVGGVNWRWSIQFHSRRVLCYIIPIASMAVLFNIPKVGPLHDQSSITLLSEGNLMKWRYFFSCWKSSIKSSCSVCLISLRTINMLMYNVHRSTDPCLIMLFIIL